MPPPPNIQLKFGPMLIGVFFNMILYGVLIVQAFIYYRTYKKDAPWIRYFVLYLFIVETLNTGFDMYMMYEPLVLRYGTPHATTYFPIVFPSQPIMVVAVSTPIQIFLAWRIKIITKSNWIAVIICFLAIVGLAGGIGTSVKVATIRLFSRKPELHAPALVWFCSACVADILITITLVRSLTQRRTGFSKTDDTIDRIIRLTVQTGMMTAIASVGDVVFFMVLPHTALNFLWDLALSKLYTNSLLSTLNARAGWNNLAGQGSTNLLFTEASGDAPRARKQNESHTNNSMMLGTTILELEEQKQFGEAAKRAPRDEEYGIAVTKVVERMVDPSHFVPETTQ